MDQDQLEEHHEREKEEIEANLSSLKRTMVCEILLAFLGALAFYLLVHFQNPELASSEEKVWPDDCDLNNLSRVKDTQNRSFPWLPCLIVVKVTNFYRSWLWN